MKHIFIINPAAGKRDRTEELRGRITAACRAHGYTFEILASAAPGDCASLARAAAQTGEDVRLYACGGDGTLNEVVNGMAGFANAAVTHVPCGSGNDFIKLFSDPAPFSDLERLFDAQEADFDLIRCNETHSINILSVGLDAKIAADLPRFKHLPLVSGKGAYILSIVRNLFGGLSDHYRVTLPSGETVDTEQTLVCVCNGRWYGGGFNPVPEARPDDGLMDVLLVRKVNLLQAAGVIGNYQKGRYADYPALFRHERCTALRIECPHRTVVNVDGESYFTTDARITLLPHAIRFFYPKGLTY